MTERPGGAVGGQTLRVSVTLKGVLADRFPGGRTDAEVAAGDTVGTLVEVLALPQSSYIFVVNGAAVDRRAPLSDGDRVQIHPPMAGG